MQFQTTAISVVHKCPPLRRLIVLYCRLLQRNQGDDDDRSKYEKDRIAHAKRIMKPFFLRRLKSEVLTDLPQKSEEVMRIPMVEEQHDAYFNLVTEYKARAKAVSTFYSIIVQMITSFWGPGIRSY